MPPRPIDGSDRSKYIGGSDAAAILGVSPWRSLYRLWCEKVAQDETPDLSLKSWIEWGNRLEPLVAEVFAEKQKLKIRVEPKFLIHKQHSFMGGHIDRRILGARAFLECKTTNAYDNRMWGDEEEGVLAVPRHYVAQCDHYLMVGDFEYCFVAVLIGGSDFRVYRIERDAHREKRLLDAELEFWSLVQSETMPPITNEADAKHRWETSLLGVSVPVDDEIRRKVIALSRVTERERIAKKEKETLRNEIFPVFEDAQALSFNGERIAELTSFLRSDFDLESLRKKHPKIAAKFERKLPAKRLKLLV